MRKIKITASAMVLVLLMCGFACNASSWERTTFQALSASKAVIDQAQADYESGVLPHSQKSYDVINKAKNVQTLAVNAMTTYEGIKANGGSATAQQAAQADVATFLSQLPALIADVKALYTKAGSK